MKKIVDEARVYAIINNAVSKIENKTEAEIKADMKLIVVSLIEFVGVEESRILDPNTPGEDIGKLFFKLVIGIGTDALTSSMSPFHKKKIEARFAGMMKLLPLLKQYANVD